MASSHQDGLEEHSPNQVASIREGAHYESLTSTSACGTGLTSFKAPASAFAAFAFQCGVSQSDTLPATLVSMCDDQRSAERVLEPLVEIFRQPGWQQRH